MADRPSPPAKNGIRNPASITSGQWVTRDCKLKYHFAGESGWLIAAKSLCRELPGLFLKEVPYHITQRGNARQEVFFDDADHELYLDLLSRPCTEARLPIQAYCLMPNQIHLIATPERSGSMAAALSRTHADFARHFNLKRRACGHVWQARYFSCPLDRAHCWHAIAYVGHNPVRARLENHAQEFRWSSAGARLGRMPAPRFLDLAP